MLEMCRKTGKGFEIKCLTKRIGNELERNLTIEKR